MVVEKNVDNLQMSTICYNIDMITCLSCGRVALYFIFNQVFVFYFLYFYFILVFKLPKGVRLVLRIIQNVIKKINVLINKLLNITMLK
jgi:hypothetical protein